MKIDITKQKVASLIFAVIVVAGINYAVAQTPGVSHSPAEIVEGTFGSSDDNFVFPNNLDVDGNLIVDGSLTVNGDIDFGGGTIGVYIEHEYCENTGALTISETSLSIICGQGYGVNWQLVNCYYDCTGLCKDSEFTMSCLHTDPQTCTNTLAGNLIVS